MTHGHHIPGIPLGDALLYPASSSKGIRLDGNEYAPHRVVKEECPTYMQKPHTSPACNILRNMRCIVGSSHNRGQTCRRRFVPTTGRGSGNQLVGDPESIGFMYGMDLKDVAVGWIPNCHVLNCASMSG